MFEQAFNIIGNVLWKEAALTNCMGMMRSMGTMKTPANRLATKLATFGQYVKKPRKTNVFRGFQ